MRKTLHPIYPVYLCMALICLFGFLLISGCGSHETSIDDIAQEVASKGKSGVSIDIEPLPQGKK